MRILATSLIFFLIIFSVDFAESKNLGKVGAVYQIVERDALEEIMDRVSRIDWAQVFGREQSEALVRNYRPSGFVELQRAERDRTFGVDMTYTLDRDLLDSDGMVIYPEGYSFNPLDYVSYPNVLVFLNGEDREQVKWFKASGYKDDLRVRVLVTEGSYYDLSLKLERSVFYADSRIVERLGLRALPSVVNTALAHSLSEVLLIALTFQ